MSHSLTVSGRTRRKFKRLRRDDAVSIRVAINETTARGKIGPGLTLATKRQEALELLLAKHIDEQRWVPHEAVHKALISLPTTAGVFSSLTPSEHEALRERLTPQEIEALDFLDRDHRARISAINQEILKRESRSRRAFFDTVEKSPLTDEQVAAVVTFDNRVRVIAAAGSGKTSVMVGRAAYAIARGIVPADRILMLAFNADAATELRDRVHARLAALGLTADRLNATTFHAFGLSVIGKATGRKPHIAPWMENGQDLAKVMEIIDELRDSSADFRFKWDVFRLLYGELSDQPDGGEPDSYDSASRQPGFQTYHGETVRSQGERLIANWLFLNGITYEYERPYAHDVADSDHSQYRPDFYYPDIQVWHEHWALRADGTPPASFAGYAESMRWKKHIHERFGTSLLETTWHEIIDLSGFQDLARKLRAHGLTLDWNPDRAIPGAKPLEHERLARLVRTFMSHVKAGSLNRDSLTADLTARPELNTPRTRLFLDLYWQIHDRWEAALRESGTVDFDDMLVRAAELIESDSTLAHFDLVMVDEFQDTSRVRARLIQALTRGEAKYLLAVGDDWQAINRFAGADLSLMTDFSALFGSSETRRLQTTFRCSQTISDVASRFVSRNPTQIAKQVKAARGERGVPVTIVRVDSREALPSALDRHLTRLATDDPGSTVDVLGRYRFDQQLVPRKKHPQLRVTFRTIHGSKGLEADHVVLPNVTSGTYGFPSQISDDPVLSLVMSDDDRYPHSEERRLLYVALTRARHSVTLITVTGLESPFVVELLQDPDVSVVDSRAAATDVRVCPQCSQGTLVHRKGPYGNFLGCSRFPACRQTVRL